MCFCLGIVVPNFKGILKLYQYVNMFLENERSESEITPFWGGHYIPPVPYFPQRLVILTCLVWSLRPFPLHIHTHIFIYNLVELFHLKK